MPKGVRSTVKDSGLLQAALIGLEAQRQKIEEQISQVQAMLGKRRGRPPASAKAEPPEKKPAGRRKLSAAAREENRGGAEAPLGGIPQGEGSGIRVARTYSPEPVPVALAGAVPGIHWKRSTTSSTGPSATILPFSKNTARRASARANGA